MEKTPLNKKQKAKEIKLARKIKHTQILSHTAVLLPVSYCLLPINTAFAITVSVGLNPTPVFTKTNVKSGGKPSFKEPVLLTAENVDYDKETSVVTASGNVEVVQGEFIMLADNITYDQVKNSVKARGGVSVMDAAGNVIFADSLELTDNLKTGIIKEFKARLNDNSLFAATSAKKHDENITELRNAVYSPCRVCSSDEENGNYPLWQLSAKHITIDKEEQRVSYDDALMEIYGTPIFYTPYFSHPTPNADNKSGLLEPTLKQSTNLGTVYKQPFYYSIAPDRDVTVTPILTTLEGPVFAGEYRQQFNNGSININGSITKPQTRDAGGITSKGQDWRGHFDGSGYFDIDESSNAGFNIRRTSDDTYLRRYDFSDDSLLISRLYAEKRDFIGEMNTNRSSAVVQAIKFNGLNANDNSRTTPLILPLADFNWQSQEYMPYNSRFSVDGNFMSLTRDEGAKSRRIVAVTGWTLPYITEDGQVIEFNAQLRGDVYSINDHILGNGENYNGEVARVIPQASATWRYPFINQWENGNLLIEPIVMFAISPNSSNSNKIPNEDSQVPEFNTSNLFSPNRFAGYDRIETGSQVSYGIRGQAQVFNDKYVNWLFGQHYHRNSVNDFPYTNNSNSNFSDYVGKLDVYYDPVYLSYRTRLDKDHLSFNQNELSGTINYYPVTLGTSYLSLKNDPTLQNKEEISGSFGVNITRQWNLSVSATKDLELGQLSNAYTNLIFSNECLYIVNSFGRNYTSDRDIKPSTNYMLRVAFKNLE